MLKNYLTIAIRNLMRHKLYSVINIAGLAMGIACCILILLYVRYEWHYEAHVEKRDRIYRVIREIARSGGESFFQETAPGALAGALKHDFPEIEQVVRTWVRERWVRHADRAFVQVFCLADPEILDMFNLKLLQGDPKTALAFPGSILVTQETARKFFGEEDAMGKIVTVDHIDFRGDYAITGILENLPSNANLTFDFLTTTVSNDYARDIWENWRHNTSWHPLRIYVQAADRHAPASLQRKLIDASPQYRSQTAPAPITYHFQPLSRIHLYSARDYGIDNEHYGDIQTIALLALMAVFILLIASINFMGLTTARSAQRTREVGLRKVVGAHRGQLIRQFLGESILQALLALVLALALVEFALPEFNRLTGRPLSFGADWTTMMGLFGLALLTGVLAGSYPAFFLSVFPPISVLKSPTAVSVRGAWTRKGLVICQFAISIALVIGTVVVHGQMQFIRNKNLGFDKEQVLVMPLFYFDRAMDPSEKGMLTERATEVKQAFLQHPNVRVASASRGLPGNRFRFDVVLPEGKEGETWQMHVVPADADFLDLFGIELLAGRNLSEDIASDVTQAYLLNETAVRQLGWEEPLGKRFEWVADQPRQGVVVGVVKDFHMSSLREEIEPVVICMQPHVAHWLSLKIRPERPDETLRFVETTWKRFIPTASLTYFFLDERLNQRYYQKEMWLGQIFRIASILAIFVASLGLFGLAAFTTQQRTKEIGIRKVLGASASGIVLMLSRDFVKLVLIANLIAWPVAYYAMNRWLENFAYRMELGWEVFVLSGGLALLIALLTVSGQAWRAARANPVDALRNE